MPVASPNVPAPVGEDLPRRRALAILAGIVVLTLLARLPLLAGDFIAYDDGIQIFRNPVIKDLTPSNLRETLLTNFRGVAASPMHTVNMLNWAATPRYAGFAIVNMAWLAALTVLFYRFAALFLDSRAWRLVATAFFTLASCNADSVAWMSSRCHFFGVGFVMLAFVLWQAYLDEIHAPRRALFYALACLAGAAAIWNKSVFVSVSVLLFVYDLYRQRRLHPLMFLDKLPLLALAVVPLMNPPHVGGVTNLDHPSMGGSFTATLLTDAGLLVEYLRALVVPGPGTVANSVYAVSDPLGVSEGASLLALRLPPVFNMAVLALVGAGLVLLWRRGLRQPLFAGLFILAALAPMMNIPPRWVEFAFRFEWLPSLFFSVAVAASAAFFWPRLGRAGRVATAAALGLLLAWHAGQTFVQSRYWHDPEAYWKACIRNFPDSQICYLKLGIHYADKGLTRKTLAEYERLDRLNSQLDPKRTFQSAKHLGDLCGHMGDGEKARFYYERSLLRDELSDTERTVVKAILAGLKKKGGAK
ncbi:MAG: hypothetical protein PHU25_18615 [Deltaproteobacteria bacterium]|nr:hypothetical protein [Deltaproteobacteria bacterium]